MCKSASNGYGSWIYKGIQHSLSLAIQQNPKNLFYFKNSMFLKEAKNVGISRKLG